MKTNETTDIQGGAVRLTRIFTGIAAAIATALALTAASASATTVYNYVYAGTYFDGSGAGHPFDERISGIEYDRAHHLFYVSDGNKAGEFGTLGTITKITPSGVGVDFPATGTPQLTSTRRLEYPEYELTWEFENPEVSVDQTGGPNEGNIYATGSGRMYGWDAEGNPLPGFEQPLSETGIGIVVLKDGNLLVNGPARGKTTLYNSKGEKLHEEYNPGSPGLKPSVNAKWSEFGNMQRAAADNEDNIYAIALAAPDGEGQLVKATDEAKELYELNHAGEPAGPTTGVAVDHSNDQVFDLRANSTFESFDSEGRLLGKGWGVSDPSRSYAGLNGSPIGIAVDPETNDVWVANRRSYGGTRRVEEFEAVEPHVIPKTTAVSPDYSDPTGNTIVLRGEVNPDEHETTDCHFEYGTAQNELTNTVPCTQGATLNGSEDVEVTTTPISVKHGIRYWYKVSAKNSDNQVAPSNTQSFIPQAKPLVGTTVVTRVNTDGAQLNTELDPNGGNASVHFDYGVKGGPLDQSTPETDTVGFNTENENFGSTSQFQPGVYRKTALVTGLSAETNYEYQAVITNEAGVTKSPIGEFRTFAPDAGTDACANALVRKQTGSALLLDCRAYELASAANAGGFDVESDIVSGLAPLTAYPRAQDSLLYSLHFGVVPGIAGSPTNLGLDPYVARRGEDGWTTEYVGLPADEMADEGAFGSPLLAADPSLHEFAFGGKNICEPCFEDGTTNEPLRLSTGKLVEGLSGSTGAAGDPAERVAQPFSADGNHLVFGSKAKFEPTGDSGGSIYERDLKAGTTQVVSTLPGGATMTGGEVGELGISTNGSRVVVGKRISTDAKGNEYWHLYMHLGSSANAVDLMPGTVSAGALYDGMNADGSRVYFTTRDKLLGEDTDSMADIYEAEVDGAGIAHLRLITTDGGAASNDESCTPPGSPVTWNSISGDGKCDAVAFAGGAGVADDGSFYFVSPELLDGAQGEKNQANLYLVEPGGDPQFVATIDSSVDKPGPQPPAHPVVNQTLISGLKNPGQLAVDQASGDIYVAERGNSSVDRFTSSGAAAPFSEGPNAGTNKLTGQSLGEQTEGQIAVDSGSPSGNVLQGALYVTTNGGEVYVYSKNGKKLGALSGFGEACGVSVEQSTGAVYVGSYSGTIQRFVPSSPSDPISNADYTETGIATSDSTPCNVEADSAGHVFDRDYSSGVIRRYNTSAFAVGNPPTAGSVAAASGKAIQSDAANSDLYVDQGGQITRYDSAGTQIQSFGTGKLSASLGVAIDATNKHVYASSGGNIVEFGFENVPFTPVDNPGIVDGVDHSGARNYRGIQISADARYALFSSTQPLTGYANLGQSELFRYDTHEGEILCVSCSPTGAAPSFGTELSPSGLSLTDDGRVFFTTAESLALRDTNEKTDVYEWELPPAGPAVGACEVSTGCIQLISTGIGPDNSGLVTVSADGTDAFFFTREVLAHEDENGNAVKIYDAREGGGFLHDPARKPCAASDECHGAGSEVPAAPVINTITGSDQEQKTEKPCKGGSVKKHGKCVKKHGKKKKHKRHHHRKSSHGNR